MNRTLTQYAPLEAYFTKTSAQQTKDLKIPRFARLNQAFLEPMTEVHLLFLQAALPVFTKFNKFLQYEHPIIHVLYDAMLKFVGEILSNFVKVALTKKSLESHNFEGFEEEIVENKNIFIGFTTKQKLRTLKTGGKISEEQIEEFYDSIKVFYIKAVNYLLENLPLDNEIIKHAAFVDFEKREKLNFDSVQVII